MRNLSFRTREDPVTKEMVSSTDKRRVFISYRHSDENTLPSCSVLIRLILEQYDVAVWYDAGLTAGAEYDEEIKEAIRQSDAFILILSINILSSSYIWAEEVPYAKEMQVPIIPIQAGLSMDDIPEVEKRVGKIHIPLWFSGKHETVPPFSTEFKEQFANGLGICIASKSLMEKVKLFYQRGNQNTSMKYLTQEDLFLKAYGALFGVETFQDKKLGSSLLETICNSFAADAEFSHFQEKVTEVLLKHAFSTDQPNLLISYLKLGFARGYQEAYEILRSVYSKEWHTELLMYETGLSMDFLTMYCMKRQPGYIEFRNKFQVLPYTGQKPEDNATTTWALKHKWLKNYNPSEFETKRVGELRFGSHIAYLQKKKDSEEVCLICDDTIIKCCGWMSYSVEAPHLFLAYDASKAELLIATSEFDHYSIESDLDIYFFKIDEDGYYGCGHGAIAKGAYHLPYGPQNFGITWTYYKRTGNK